MPFTRLRYHIVSRTYDRLPLITPAVEAVLHPAMRHGAALSGGKVLTVGGTDDHVHVIAAVRASVSISHFVRGMKSISSQAVRRRFGADAFRWQTGYSAFTLRYDDFDGCVAYVRNQKAHHGFGTTQIRFERDDQT